MASASAAASRPSSSSQQQQQPQWTICKASYSASSARRFSSSSSSHPRPLVDAVALPRLPNTPAGRILAAATEGDIPRLRKLVKRLQEAGKGIEEEVAALDLPVMKRRGPLHMAAWLGRLEMCKFLIKDLRLDVDVTDSTGAVPLHFAIQGPGCTAIVRLLLDRGADPNKADSAGFTPLHAATSKDLYEIAELLLSRGACVDSVYEKGAPLHIAAKDGNVRMVELLLRHKADPNRVVRLFYTPLIVAIFASSLKCVELLIKAGADVNAGKPVTPLIVAANDGLKDCTKCLLEAGADANIPDEFGRMPVEIAAIQGWDDCVEILFPLTSPVARFADWSIEGITQFTKKVGTSKTQDQLIHENSGSFAKVQGDAAFQEKDYAHASALYTVAMETDNDDSTLYAKRSLCWLYSGERTKALDDANTYKDMEPDLSRSCYEQGAALLLVKEYDQACKALVSGLSLDFGSNLSNEASRKKHP